MGGGGRARLEQRDTVGEQRRLSSSSRSLEENHQLVTEKKKKKKKTSRLLPFSSYEAAPASAQMQPMFTRAWDVEKNSFPAQGRRKKKEAKALKNPPKK